MSLNQRVCPDKSDLGDYWEIKNGYSNKTERLSFSFEIIKTPCEDDPLSSILNTGELPSNKCPTNDEVARVLSLIQITAFYI
jgi:hypothetical protein